MSVNDMKLVSVLRGAQMHWHKDRHTGNMNTFASQDKFAEAPWNRTLPLLRQDEQLLVAGQSKYTIVFFNMLV